MVLVMSPTPKVTYLGSQPGSRRLRPRLPVRATRDHSGYDRQKVILACQRVMYKSSQDISVKCPDLVSGHQRIMDATQKPGLS